MSDEPIARRVLAAMRRQMSSTVVDIEAFRAGTATAEALQRSVATPKSLESTDPAHALYMYVQNQMSVMAEQLLELDEMRVFAKLLSEADREYVPSWPPISPITTSYFWCWSNLDLAANAHRETVGSVIVRVGAQYGMHPNILALMKIFNDSRMGLYRIDGHTPGGVQLLELLTRRRCTAICESGYLGVPGELCFTRLLPPATPDRSEHVVFTSPYILVAPEEATWVQYLDRIAAADPKRYRSAALERRFKWDPRVGIGPNSCSRVTSITGRARFILKDCLIGQKPDLIRGRIQGMPMDSDEEPKSLRPFSCGCNCDIIKVIERA